MLFIKQDAVTFEPDSCEKKRSGNREPDDVEDEDSELFGAAAGRRFCDDEVQSPAQAGCNKRKIGQPDELPFNGKTHIPPLYRICFENLQFELIYIRCEGTASVKVGIPATSRFFYSSFLIDKLKGEYYFVQKCGWT